MILTALLFAILSANLPSAILHALNLKTLFAMSNAKNQNAKLNAPIKDAKCLIAPSASLSANNLIALLTAKPPNLNANLFVKNPNATGNATSQTAPSPSANLSVKTPTAFLKLNAALAPSELPESLNPSHSSKKPKNKTNAANAKNKLGNGENYLVL